MATKRNKKPAKRAAKKKPTKAAKKKAAKRPAKKKAAKKPVKRKAAKRTVKRAAKRVSTGCSDGGRKLANCRWEGSRIVAPKDARAQQLKRKLGL